MKEGLFLENGELIYYKHDRPKHAGVVRVDGAIYYISSGGRAVKGQHIVHKEMANGILERGTYVFGDDYKLIEGSHIPAKKRSKKKGKKKRSFKSKKHKRLMKIMVAAIICFMIVFVAVDVLHINNRKATTADGAGSTQTEPTVKHVILPTFEEEVVLCSEGVLDYYADRIPIEEAIRTGDPYRNLVFKYRIWEDGTLLLSENPEFADAKSYILLANDQHIAIDNLKTGTTYYWRVTTEGEVYDGSFRTAQTPRFLTIPGVANVRDIGGYTTLDGKTVRQGLLIRGSEMDGLEAVQFWLPEEDLEEVQETFGFVHDFDLRYTTIYAGEFPSRLGEDVTHTVYNSPQYAQTLNQTWYGYTRQIFTDLANPDNYPMYLHCAWGKDRTGTIVYLLQGILNVPEEDMMREYRLSAFASVDIATHPGIDALIGGMNMYEGDTIQEKIVSFLTTEIGVTEAEIESIRRIFLEG